MESLTVVCGGGGCGCGGSEAASSALLERRWSMAGSLDLGSSIDA